MANVIIRSDERREREARILRDFGRDPNRADKHTRELADATAEYSRKALRELEDRR